MSVLSKHKKVFLITINHSNAGFFAYVTFVLNQLAYCEKHNYLPVVYFGPHSGDGRNAFYDPAHGENTWDYYFKPVAKYTYQDIQTMLTRKEISPNDIVQLSIEELWHLHQGDPESIYNYPYGYYKHKYILDEAWYQQQRSRAQDYINRYICVHEHIKDKVNQFTEQYFKTPMLGIHLRGTDKGTARSHPNLMKVVPPAEYFLFIDDYLVKNPQAKIFMATDQRQFIEVVKERYPNKLVYYDAIRSTSFRNPFQKEDGNYYRKGEDVLVDCLLLSRCDFLLKCTSAVGEYAMYFNPNLDCIDLNHIDDQPSLRDRLSVWIRLFKIRFVFKWIALSQLIRERRK